MKEIVLGLSQLIAIAWVWQQELTPKYLPIWQENRSRCGTIRRPEIHVGAYNAFLDQLFSTAKGDIKYTKGALCLFISVSDIMMTAFSRLDPRLKKYTPGFISAEKQLVKPQEDDLAEARSIIRTMLSVDSMGNPMFDPFFSVRITPSKKD